MIIGHGSINPFGEKQEMVAKTIGKRTGTSTVKGARKESKWQERLKNSQNLEFMNLKETQTFKAY